MGRNSKIQTYLREVLSELRKVVWPDARRTAKMTGVVIGMVALVGAFLFLLDLPLGWVLDKLIQAR